jgi:hypothetical protein
VHNDGIDIFLMADDANTQGGAANNIPSDYFFVSGSYWDPPFGSISKSRVSLPRNGALPGLVAYFPRGRAGWAIFRLRWRFFG